MKKYYININRQFGSLGRPIAIKLAEILQIEYYDRDIVEETAKRMDVSVAKVSAQDEVVRSKFSYMAFPLGEGHSENQSEIFNLQVQIIRGMAAKGSAIFVGRCADYILRNYSCLNVFIYAPKAQRYLNCVNSLGMTPVEAKKMIEKVDQARERYWMKYAKHMPGDLESTHLMVDSSLFGVAGTAELIASIVKDHFSFDMA